MFKQTSLFGFVLLIFIYLNCGGSKPSRFYVLSSMQLEEIETEIGEVNIGIGPVFFPEYLLRPQIVIHENPNKLAISEFDRWAEPLEDNFLRILIDNLATITKNKKIYKYPWHAAWEMDYHFTFTIQNFELEPNSQILLDIWWSLIPEPGVETFTKRSTFREPVKLNQKIKEEDYEKIVAAMSRTVEMLSREVAAEIALLVENDTK